LLDFTPVRNNEMTYAELVEELTVDDLCQFTVNMFDKIFSLISGCEDSDVVFVPQDPFANDPYASSEAETDLAWTLGHVIVHVTASSEESAFLSAELARGVSRRRARTRYEVNWETITTMDDCRHRLIESRRMQLACLDIWPDEPHLENGYESRFGMWVNPVVQFILGLSHADSHLDQIEEIARQAKAARS
jgi:hypothetical protein